MSKGFANQLRVPDQTQHSDIVSEMGIYQQESAAHATINTAAFCGIYLGRRPFSGKPTSQAVAARFIKTAALHGIYAWKHIYVALEAGRWQFQGYLDLHRALIYLTHPPLPRSGNTWQVTQ